MYKPNCPRCGQPMKQYNYRMEVKGKHPRPDEQLWGCKMHSGKWGVWITIQGFEAAGPELRREQNEKP